MQPRKHVQPRPAGTTARLMFYGLLLWQPLALAASAPSAPSATAPTATTPPASRQAPGWQPAPTNINDWADRCTDPTINSWGLKDPKNFVKVMELFSDPAIYLEFGKRMQDPEAYARVAGLAMEPATARNYMEWSDPAIYAKWMQASMDPNFYTALMKPFIDPSTYLRWMALPMDQRAWATGGQMMNPAMWMKWMTAPMNPKVMAPLAKAGDINTTTQWMQGAGTSFNPWAGWLPSLNGQAPPADNAAPAKPSGPQPSAPR